MKHKFLKSLLLFALLNVLPSCIQQGKITINFEERVGVYGFGLCVTNINTQEKLEYNLLQEQTMICSPGDVLALDITNTKIYKDDIISFTCSINGEDVTIDGGIFKDYKTVYFTIPEGIPSQVSAITAYAYTELVDKRSNFCGLIYLDIKSK